jgi:flagellin
LRGLADAINAASGSTGTTATVTTSGTLELVNEQGDDIHIVNLTDSAGTDVTMTIAGANGTNATIDAAGSNDGIVGGQVTFTSSGSFSVNAAATIHDASVDFNNVSLVNIGTQTGSNDALSVLDGALRAISDSRADLGAIQNRLDSTISNLSNVVENVSAARSRVQDADFAKETAELTRGQILQQAGVAMLAQANASQQSVLALLQ